MDPGAAEHPVVTTSAIDDTTNHDRGLLVLCILYASPDGHAKKSSAPPTHRTWIVRDWPVAESTIE